MAEGRDLKISILSDLEGFDTDRAATDLEQLGDSARDASRRMDDYEASADSAQRSLAETGDASRDAARDLDDVGTAARDSGDDLKRAGDDAKDYGRETERALDDVGDAARDAANETERHLKDSSNAYDRYGDQAEQTARKVDDAFDRIAAASRSNTRKVDADLDRAKRGMDDFKDEAGQTGREAAASFGGGFDDITDVVQELGANAFAGFGPLGAAAGIAAAAGLGVIVSTLEKGAEKANELKARMVDLSRTIVDAGGDIKDVDLADEVASWSDEIADNKSWWELWQEANTTNFEKVQRASEETGIALSDMLGAMSGVDADAGTRVIEELNRQIEEQNDLLEKSGELRYEQDGSINAVYQSYVREIDALEERRDIVMEALGLTEESIQRAKDYEEAVAPIIEQEEREAAALEKAKEAQERLTEAREEAAEALQSFGEVGDAYTEAAEENADSQVASIQEVIAAQEKQIEAQRDWADNMEKLYERGVDEGALANLARLEEEGAPLVAALTEASDEELEAWVRNTKELGGDGASGFIASLLDGQPGVERAGRGLGQAAVDGINDKRDNVRSAARGTRRAMENEIAGSPISADVNLNGPSQWEYNWLRGTITGALSGITVPVHPAIIRNERYVS